jgi:hypothetical protein
VHVAVSVHGYWVCTFGVSSFIVISSFLFTFSGHIITSTFSVPFGGINMLGVSIIDMSTPFWTYSNRTIYLIVYEFIRNYKIAFWLRQG